jgi:AcrR family transcriptional regulator
MGMERATYHHGNLRQALIEAALELALERGPEGVSVREAARRVGVSPGAPFRHFPDRRALMTAVAQEATERLRIEVRHAVRPADKTALRRVLAMGRGYLRWAERHPAHFRIVSARDQIDVETSPGLLRGMLAGREEAEDVICAAQAEGDIDPAHDTQQLALLARACVYGQGPVSAMEGVAKLSPARPSRRVTPCVRRHAQGAQRRGAGWAELPFGLRREGAVCRVARACKASALLRAGALHPAPSRRNAIPFHGANRPSPACGWTATCRSGALRRATKRARPRRRWRC